MSGPVNGKKEVCPWDSQDSIMSCIDELGSISMAYRLSKPLTLVASLLNFCEKASLRLCAGSVELRREAATGDVHHWQAKQAQVGPGQSSSEATFDSRICSLPHMSKTDSRCFDN